jgi:hypothetical protein
VIVATRAAQAELWLGLRADVSREQYREWIDAQATESLLESLHRMAVRPGDVVFLPAGVPHAIGAGALIVELQEPTDFSIVCESKGFPIAAEDSHLGLGWDRAIEALRLEAFEPSLGLPENPFFWSTTARSRPGASASSSCSREKASWRASTRAREMLSYSLLRASPSRCRASSVSSAA